MYLMSVRLDFFLSVFTPEFPFEIEGKIFSVTNVFDIYPLGLLSQHFYAGITICNGLESISPAVTAASWSPGSRGRRQRFVVYAFYMGHQC